MRKTERKPCGAGIFRPGQELVIAGAIGKAGVREAIRTGRELLRKRFSEEFIRKAEEKAEKKLETVPEVLESLGATEWEAVMEGGVFAALWNISGAYEQGFAVELLKIPVEQELIEICEFFDLNPYRLLSGECMVLAAENGGALARALGEKGIRAAVVGTIEKGIARKIIGPGGTGYLERPRGDEIYRMRGLQREQEE